MEDFEYRFPRQVQFRLGLSYIKALAEPINEMFPHVFRATLIETAWHRFVRAFLPSFPSLVQRVVRTLWPRYALPACVVLKKLRDPFAGRKQIVCLKDEFANEKAMYQRLAFLQGKRIPVLYGETRCDGKRTLALSYIPGVTPVAQTPPRLTAEAFEERMRAAVGDFSERGLELDDVSLLNVMLIDDRIMFVDLELVFEADPGTLQSITKSTIAEFTNRYKSYLRTADKEWLDGGMSEFEHVQCFEHMQ
ncbi:Protein kinase-like domain protein [Niveomyces insectorum RCEF 264]|uniref:Protein kinase-like domain protein n=1 Tax=Niveomyces insectorum RCEF 264 TaxID=1081102 RepID=A0A167N2L2_9HYPO|nr:Protein kinase-like domain protein [Niveomyces insectorum RCEF 264]